MLRESEDLPTRSKLVVQHFDEDSRRSEYDTDAALALMRRNPEQLIRGQGTRMSKDINCLANLASIVVFLQAPDSFGRFGCVCDYCI
jgi:hypothetical protein